VVRNRPASITPLLLTGRNYHAVGMGGIPEFLGRHDPARSAGSARERGGVFADGIHIRYQGGQVRSLLSLLSYLGSGEYRERYLGVKIPLASRPLVSTGEPR
jgi:hypothetical protein